MSGFSPSFQEDSHLANTSGYKSSSAIKFKRTWDPFLLKPVQDEEEKTSRFVLGLNSIITCFVGILVFASGFFSTPHYENPSDTFHSAQLCPILQKTQAGPFIKLHFSFISHYDDECDESRKIMEPFKQTFWSTHYWSSIDSTEHFNITEELMEGYIQSFSVPPYIGCAQRYIAMGKPNIVLYLLLALLATIIISVNCYVKPKSNSLDILYICSSIVRILVTGIFVGSYIPIIGEEWSDLKTVSNNEVWLLISLFGIQAGTSVTCHWFGVVACKMHSVRQSFALPLVSTTIAVKIAVCSVFAVHYKTAEKQYVNTGNFSISMLCSNFTNITVDNSHTVIQNLSLEICYNLCQTLSFDQMSNVVMVGISGICWYIGFIMCTSYVWKLKVQRIERTSQLFVRRLYEAAFVGQSMLLNTRVKLKNIEQDKKRSKENIMIYLCATMWHETFDEMLKILTSVFRLDRYRSLIRKDPFEFETHIYFDDAFTEDFKGKAGMKTRTINNYVKCLVTVIEEVYRVFTYNKEVFSKANISNVEQKIMVTPYGGRLCYRLPHRNLLFVHLKDKQKIRHRKRWSQIMYLFYLLGWKMFRKYSTLSEEEKNEELINKLQEEKSNTYILALDGDTDFQPSALMLLVDRLKMYPQVGAACGRIHPTGMGPMVWFQKFEYAVGHWLQKSSEHVYGCVLCSPGCFSLFRASALMDDNVLKKYSTKSTEATHYVQYDQGEDRWLCTLILQQGWRVEYNAASDAYTNAPQEFEEFYNQRRRWGPSTMANTLDLLHTGGQTAKRNPSISLPYVLYQTLTMTSSILSPATVCLMIAGSFSFLFQWHGNGSLLIAIFPPALYIVICYVAKPKTQITIAGILSVCYAFLMTATIFCIIGDMIRQQTFVTPTGIFLISMGLIYLITALLHPQEFSLIIYGLLYVICVPSAYLLLTIYSLVNMNNVTWGTREAVKPIQNKKKEDKKVKYKKSCNCFCCDIDIQINEKENVLKEFVQPVPTESQEGENEIKEEEKHICDDGWIQELQNISSYNVLKKEELEEEEVPFWESVIKHYLEPLHEDKKKQAEVAKDLKSLRNKVTFLFFLMNLLWIVATFFLQLIGSSISIVIPKVYPNGTVSTTEKLYVEPIGFMFLISFAILLLLQFGALLYHRIYTLIHFIAYQETEGKGNRETTTYESDSGYNMTKRNEHVYENHEAIKKE
ncbi:chitin synthase chs-2-like [Bombina bombina]|uniref:chitin synthase chs-2-like n=1 Tax=Bombina bombina TaxID=8345 RepID=UPI00235A9CB7|nr:chitin synthase chs-2-like [Bombina bombina]